MQVNLFCNRQDPNNLKFYVAPAELLSWIKEINVNGEKWEQDWSESLKEKFNKLGFKKTEVISVSFLNYENEILKYLQEMAPETFDTMSKAWIYAEENGYKVTKTVAFVE